MGLSLTILPFVLSEVNPWLDVIQNDMDGGSDYTPYGGWTNILKTGNLIYEFGLVGDSKGGKIY